MAVLCILTVAPQREIGCCRQRSQQPHQSLCGGRPHLAAIGTCILGPSFGRKWLRQGP
jgi:hypothetical protein